MLPHVSWMYSNCELKMLLRVNDVILKRPNTQIKNLRIGNSDFHSCSEHFKTSLKGVLKL